MPPWPPDDWTALGLLKDSGACSIFQEIPRDGQCHFSRISSRSRSRINITFRFYVQSKSTCCCVDIVVCLPVECLVTMLSYAMLHAVNKTNAMLSSLGDLWSGRWCELSLKYSVPEAAGDAKTVLVIHEMMLKVVFLQLAVVGG